MLTLEKLKSLPANYIFALGEIRDCPNGLNMTGSGKTLGWVAVRGSKNDWAIYCDSAQNTYEHIKRWGNKVYGVDHIKKLVPCDSEAFAMYRF